MDTKINSDITIESFKGKTLEEVEAILKERELDNINKNWQISRSSILLKYEK